MKSTAGVDTHLYPLEEGMTDKEVNDFHNELDKVVHKHIGHSSDEDEEKERLTKKVNEGYEGEVSAILQALDIEHHW